jgi:hypothetical protein
LLYKDHFEQFKKDELLAYAKSLRLKGISSLRKADLIDRITEKLTAPETMLQRFAMLDDEQIALFEKAADAASYEVTTEEEFDAISLDEMYCALLPVTKGDEMPEGPLVLTVPEEMKAAYQAMDKETLEQRRSAMQWLLKCMTIGELFYGVTPIGVLAKLYRIRPEFQVTEEELLSLLDQIPEEMRVNVLLQEETLGDQKDAHGFLVNSELMEEQAYLSLLEQQDVKDYYIPSYEEICNLMENGYLAAEPAYQAFVSFLRDECHMDGEMAEDSACMLWLNICDGTDCRDEVQWLIDRIDVDAQGGMAWVERLAEKVNECESHTRMLVNRGYMPVELIVIDDAPSDPIPQTAYSSVAISEPLNVLAPELRTMRMNAVIPSTVRPQAKAAKVGRNDPCPCGSGKKYKKCCGR